MYFSNQIETFSSFEDYAKHRFEEHFGPAVYGYDLGDGQCKEKGCVRPQNHNNSNYGGHAQWRYNTPHGNIICATCSLSFKFQDHHDKHVSLGHAHPSVMSNRKLFDRYLKYKATN